jgi:hypothetical protein
MCKRRILYPGREQACACYTGAIKPHGELFAADARQRMIETLNDRGYVIVEPGHPLTVYQVQITSTTYGGTTYGAHLTMDGAKADAEARFMEFYTLIEESSQEEKDSTEELTCSRLEWRDEEDFFKIGRDVMKTGHVVPMAWFSETSAFKIIKQEIKP